MHSLMVLITSSVINTEELNFSPPCTTLCPTASISSKFLITPYSGWVNCLNTNWIPSSWFFTSCSILCFSPLTVCVKKESDNPIFSKYPFAIKFSFSISINWYLMDELPQFTTKTFIKILLLPFWMFLFDWL